MRIIFFALLPIFFSVVVLFWWSTQTHRKNFIFNSHRYSASECSGWGCGCVCVCVGLVKRSVSSEWIHSFHIKISDDMWWRRRLLRYLLCLYTDRWQRYERWNKRTDGHTATMMNELKNKTCKYFKLREWGMEYF